MSKIINIPNILSMFRLALIPVFVVMYFREEYWFAVSIVAIAGLTDVVDGYIARHFNMITVLGKILDPLADKLMQVSVLICLAITHPMVRPMAAIHLVKETSMLIGGVWLFRKQRKPYSARWWGKMSTVVIVCTLILIIQNCIVADIVALLSFLEPFAIADTMPDSSVYMVRSLSDSPTLVTRRTSPFTSPSIIPLPQARSY